MRYDKMKTTNITNGEYSKLSNKELVEKYEYECARSKNPKSFKYSQEAANLLRELENRNKYIYIIFKMSPGSSPREYYL